MKLGRNPSPELASFKLDTFVDVERVAFAIAQLPTPPKQFGHEVGVPFIMGGNDTVGDCVLAGAVNEGILDCHATGKPAAFKDSDAIRAYSDITGYDPADPNTDRGTDMVAAAKYRQKHGIVDSAGNVHRIGAYLDVPIDVSKLEVAMYLFGAAGLGITVTDRTMKQFDQGLYWSMTGQKGSPSDGGHYIPGVARRGSHTNIVSWAKLVRMTDGFLKTFCDEILAYVPLDYLDSGGHTPEGFDVTALNSALAKL
ncbi:MAG: hypothetical protein P4L93_11725 [Coriobacteriia bacterium]|nr:hypothetical protein [Coriobacteriia bacterium]